MNLRAALPRERFSRVPSMFDSLGVEVPIQPDGGEGLAKHKGGIVRSRLKAVQRKTATGFIRAAHTRFDARLANLPE